MKLDLSREGGKEDSEQDEVNGEAAMLEAQK